MQFRRVAGTFLGQVAFRSTGKEPRQAGGGPRGRSPRGGGHCVARWPIRKARRFTARRALVYESGNTYSRTCSTTIGSESLTAVFGMGTGVTFQIWSPERAAGGLSPATAADCLVVFLRAIDSASALCLERSIHVAKHSSVSTG